MSSVEDITAILKHDQSNISSESGTTLTIISPPEEIITSTEEFLLTEDIDSQEETEDESDEVNPIYFKIALIRMFRKRLRNSLL